MLLEGYFGVVQAGAIILPMNVRLTPAELGGILNDSGAQWLLFEPIFAPLVEALKPNCPSIETYVALGEIVKPAVMSYEEILDAGRPERADIYGVDENSIAELFYTSGSTGTPKGVMLSHRTLYLHALSLYTVYQNVDTMVNLHTIPLFHANGWGHPQALDLLRGQAGDGAGLQSGKCSRSDCGAQGHRHVSGAGNGQCAAECAGTCAGFSIQPPAHYDRRCVGLSGSD